MSAQRQLPKKRNPLLAPENTLDHTELASRRRLGSTTLAVKPGQVGTSNATKPENLGTFEYVHLRAPLPENLKSSEIFAPQPKLPHLEAYFLMRRSSDGFVSATGMFKASFPWAKQAEEHAEREYIKSLPSTGQDEVAGNVWIPEKLEEYGIVAWILALLDPLPVQSGATPGTKESSISSPPKFVFSANDKHHLPPPIATPGRARGRPKASSPVKATAGAKAAAGAVGAGPQSPRKRTTKAVKEANAAAARQASDNLQAALDSAASVTESVADSAVDAKDEEDAADDDRVTVTVSSAVEVNGDVETKHTNVQVKMPAGNPALPLPETTEQMIEKAKQMVHEAAKLEGSGETSVTSKKSAANKRKAEILDDDDDDDDAAAMTGKELKPAKKARLAEQESKKQRVRTRALMGVAATLAIGAIVPYVLGG